MQGGQLPLEAANDTPQDYESLATALRRHGLLVNIAKVSRLDWGRNALGLLDVNYYRGTLQPRPVVDWCACPRQHSRSPPAADLSCRSSVAGASRCVCQQLLS